MIIDKLIQIKNITLTNMMTTYLSETKVKHLWQINAEIAKHTVRGSFP